MALTDPHAPGATPLTPEQLRGLRLPITTHGELNAAEQENILHARLWARSARSIAMPGMLSREFVEQLHERMYGDVWEWAGTQRLVDTNIGVPYPQIGVSLRTLFDDARYWLDHGAYEPVEFAVRLHHRMVLTHPFPNGNGRLSRFYADLALTRHFGLARLTWGGGELGSEDPRRQQYIEALQAADHHDYGPLLAFAVT
ncbi:MAG: mobile mystery protein B [Steroidobacteraceae bacterium]